MARWDKISSRGRVSDRRGQKAVSGIGGGMGLAGIAVVVAFSLLTGSELPVNDILNQLNTAQVPTQQVDSAQFEGADDYEVFASTVLGSNNDMWTSLFKAQNKTYTEPELVLFRQGTQSGCGVASSRVGPHYCSLDSTIYIDETFFDELQTRFGAEGGDVAEAYVIAHEVAHHAQFELGIFDQVASERRRNPSRANELSVSQELQADCFAGLWAHSIADIGVFEPNEIQEAINAAAAVGDDRIQEKTTGRVNPESWTHGSSAQRVEWFERGLATGNLGECNTF